MMATERTGRATALSDMLDAERARVLASASPERLAQMREAERGREVYRAWNQVCGNTREGAHVTGLRYLPESGELLVYLDGAAWVYELTTMREIIRSRMHVLGVDVAGLRFLQSKPGYAAAAHARHAGDGPRAQGHATVPPSGTGASPSKASSTGRVSPAQGQPLDPTLATRIRAAAERISDPRLRRALSAATSASLALSGIEHEQRPTPTERGL